MKTVREVHMAFSRMFHACSEAEIWLQKLPIEYTLDVHQQMPRDVYSMSLRCKCESSDFESIMKEIGLVDPHYYIDDGIVLFNYPTNFGQVPITLTF